MYKEVFRKNVFFSKLNNIMNNYGLDDNFNLVALGGAGKVGRPRKAGRPKTKHVKPSDPPLKKHTKVTSNVLEEIHEYETSGKILRGGFLFDLLATGANMIKNGVEGKRWSDNTAFKGLGAPKKSTTKTCNCVKEVKEFERSGKIMKGGFLLDFLATGINMIKNGIEGKRWSDNTVFKGLGTKAEKPKRKQSATQKQRGVIVKQVMNKFNVSLPKASTMIKQVMNDYNVTLDGAHKLLVKK